MRYEAIIDWEMTESEGHAYKLALLWEELVNKIFPNQKITTLPKKGDPRKSNLFRYCWRLQRETKGLLKPEEYRLYITAQLQILRIHNGRVEPNALCGDKAWVRWRIWKRLYDAKCKEQKETPKVAAKILNPKIVKELDCTKRFLYEKMEGEPTLEKMKAFCKKKMFKIWTLSAKVSHYYLLMSPWISKLVTIKDLEKQIGFDSGVYKGNINEDILSHFKQEFDYEFDS